MIRLLSYNIHGCVGRRGVVNPLVTLEIIKEIDADIVALQEVHDEDTVDKSFLKALEELDYGDVIYGPTMQRPAGRYGNVLMSKNRVNNCQLIDISVPGREPRGAIHISTESDGIEFKITATHLGLDAAERRCQIGNISERIRFQKSSEDKTIHILAGDFNEWLPLSRGNRILKSRFGNPLGLRTFPALMPILKLDRIYASPSNAVERVFTFKTNLARRASDHLPLVAEIKCKIEK